MHMPAHNRICICLHIYNGNVCTCVTHMFYTCKCNNVCGWNHLCSYTHTQLIVNPRIHVRISVCVCMVAFIHVFRLLWLPVWHHTRVITHTIMYMCGCTHCMTVTSHKLMCRAPGSTRRKHITPHVHARFLISVQLNAQPPHTPSVMLQYRHRFATTLTHRHKLFAHCIHTRHYRSH